MTLHNLKIADEYYDAVKNGVKTFEVRKNDRDYKVGDSLKLCPVDSNGELVRDLGFKRYITYILTHDDFPLGVPEGYVILALRRPQE